MHYKGECGHNQRFLLLGAFRLHTSAAERHMRCNFLERRGEPEQGAAERIPEAPRHDVTDNKLRGTGRPEMPRLVKLLLHLSQGQA